MKINGSTVGTPMPRSNFNQTDPKKADYIIGRENIVGKADLASVTEEILAEAKASGEFDGKDGQDGKDGSNGKDGYTPIKGVDYFDGKDGTNGKDGADGYTPQKGVDYFDGKDGKDGESYILTEQDIADIASIVLSEMPEISTYTGEVEVI